MNILVLKANSDFPTNKNTTMNGMVGVVSGYKALGLVFKGDSIRIVTDTNRVIHATVNKVEEWAEHDGKVAIHYTQDKQFPWQDGWQNYVGQKIMKGMILMDDKDLPV